MTGQFPARYRIFGHLAQHRYNAERGMPDFLDPKSPSILRYFKMAGYITGHYGKWHLGGGMDEKASEEHIPEPSAYGVDKYKVFVGKGPNFDKPNFDAFSSNYIIDESINFIREHKDKPFFLNIWLKDTHAFLNPTAEMMAPYDGWGGALKVYWGATENADRQIGRFLEKLEELGLRENTIVIFTSDNGPEDIHIPNASHSAAGSPGPFRGRKRSLYEGGIRVPFIIRWPSKIPAGRVDTKSIISGVDMLPSLCKMAGVKFEESPELDGQDMSRALLGHSLERQKPLMWDFRYRIFGYTINRSPMLAIREGKWKLLANPDKSRVELYDIIEDPMELNNLASLEKQIAEGLLQKLLDWFQKMPEGPIESAAGKNDYKWPTEKDGNL